jgi:hypothetical protein
MLSKKYIIAPDRLRYSNADAWFFFTQVVQRLRAFLIHCPGVFISRQEVFGEVCLVPHFPSK